MSLEEVIEKVEISILIEDFENRQEDFWQLMKDRKDGKMAPMWALADSQLGTFLKTMTMIESCERK
jgi:hypothetical protein